MWEAQRVCGVSALIRCEKNKCPLWQRLSRQNVRNSFVMITKHEWKIDHHMYVAQKITRKECCDMLVDRFERFLHVTARRLWYKNRSTIKQYLTLNINNSQTKLLRTNLGFLCLFSSSKSIKIINDTNTFYLFIYLFLFSPDPRVPEKRDVKVNPADLKKYLTLAEVDGKLRQVCRES